MARQHYVTFTYQTMADDPKEALELATEALQERNGGWIEVSQQLTPDSYQVTDGELAEVFPHA